MQTAEELLKEAQSLNDAKKYVDVIELLSNDILESYKNSNLYTEKAQAYWRLKEYDQCEKFVDIALSLDSENSKANYYKGNLFNEKENSAKAIEYFQKAIQSNPYFEYPYYALGNVYEDLKEYDKAIEFYNKSIALNNKFAYPYWGLGHVQYSLKNYNNSIEFYNKSLESDPEFIFAYNGLGEVNKVLRNYDIALDFYNKALTIDPLNPSVFYGLGAVYWDLKDFKKATSSFEKCMEINKSNPNPYYGRALVYQAIDDHENAIADFKKYIELTNDDADYFSSLAKSKISELEDLIKNPELSFISDLVGKIKLLLLFKGECITHYTGFSTTQALILKDSLFRLSEGTYLNDTSEGRELFDFLPSLPKSTIKLNDTEAKPFIAKPFIGSFVADNKHDDLTLWRMYGKENKEEATGCAITLEREKFLENLKDFLINDDDPISTEKTYEEFSFYRVAYRTKEAEEYFIIPGATQDEESLNKLLYELKSQLEKVLKEKKIISIRNWSELSQIAYLFKSAEYQYEYELRLIVKGTGIPKIVNSENHPIKVYIELININPLIKKITFGPKVSQADEWASIFYYTLDKQGYYPDIFISHLPFK